MDEKEKEHQKDPRGVRTEMCGALHRPGDNPTEYHDDTMDNAKRLATPERNDRDLVAVLTAVRTREQPQVNIM